MTAFIQALLGGIASGTFIAAVLSLLFLKRTTTLRKQIETEFEKGMLQFQSARLWKEKSVSELMGPVFMQLERTKRAFARWHEQNFYIEMKVIKEGNLKIRDLLLEYGHLVPPELLDDAAKLVEHYDRWIEEFERVRESVKPDLKTRFVFVGPEGFPFPRQSEVNFKSMYQKMWNELYGESKEYAVNQATNRLPPPNKSLEMTPR